MTGTTYQVTLHCIEEKWNPQPHHCKNFVTRIEKSTTLSDKQSSNSPQFMVNFLHKRRQFILTINIEQLINTMEQNTSEISSSSANEEIPCILQNPKGSLPCQPQPTTCPYPEPHQSIPCHHPVSWKSILILFFPICLGFPSGLNPHVPHPQNPICTYPLPHTSHMPSPSNFSQFDQLNSIYWEVQTIKLLSMQSTPVPYYFIPLGHKYLLIILFSKHSASVPPSVWHTKFHTHIKNRQNYGSVCFNLDIFGHIK